MIHLTKPSMLSRVLMTTSTKYMQAILTIMPNWAVINPIWISYWNLISIYLRPLNSIILKSIWGKSKRMSLGLRMVLSAKFILCSKKGWSTYLSQMMINILLLCYQMNQKSFSWTRKVKINSSKSLGPTSFTEDSFRKILCSTQLPRKISYNCFLLRINQRFSHAI